MIESGIDQGTTPSTSYKRLVSQPSPLQIGYAGSAFNELFNHIVCKQVVHSLQADSNVCCLLPVCPSALSVPIQLGGCRDSYSSCFFTICSCHVVLHPSGQQSAPPGVQAEALHSRVYGVVEEPHNASNDRVACLAANSWAALPCTFRHMFQTRNLRSTRGPFASGHACVDHVLIVYLQLTSAPSFKARSVI